MHFYVQHQLLEKISELMGSETCTMGAAYSSGSSGRVKGEGPINMKSMLINRTFNIAVNDFDAKKSARFVWCSLRLNSL